MPGLEPKTGVWIHHDFLFRSCCRSGLSMRTFFFSSKRLVVVVVDTQAVYLRHVQQFLYWRMQVLLLRVDAIRRW
jgi:hypothetical protein